MQQLGYYAKKREFTLTKYAIIICSSIEEMMAYSFPLAICSKEFASKALIT